MSTTRERYPMLKHGNLHYQVRGLSAFCEGRETRRGLRDHCECAYFSDATGRSRDGAHLVALCTCDCHAYNRAEVAS